ncbi:MAG TPA: hypothetical protein GYA06_05690 [Chloroflexi bacterium]|nr:hypothetical protein [Chloroflexota bacterium]
MKLRTALLLLVILTLAGCAAPTPTAAPLPTFTPPGPAVRTTSMPDAKAAAAEFLQAWKQDDTAGMYALLSQLSRDAIPEEEFTRMYSEVAQTLSLQEMDYEVLSSLVNPGAAQVAYRVTYHTALVGDLQRNMTMDLVLEDGQWRVQWYDGLIMPDIAGPNRIIMDISVPARGNIYDKDGEALAAQSDAYALGIIPGQIQDEDTLLAELSRLTGKDSDYIYSLYEFAGSDWYIPIGDAPASEVEPRLEILQRAGVQVSKYNTRYYFDKAAPHVVGYVQSIFAEELEEYRRAGYSGGEKVGKYGLEMWGEEYLAGQRGASLLVINEQGQIQARLGERSSKPAYSIYTTLDKDLQVQVQKALEGFRGAAVVMERDTGRILALVSSPAYNPNLFDWNNANAAWSTELADPSNPLYNRATMGEYPLGSVFKIVTMAAALESGVFTPRSTYECGHTFTELIGRTYYDWTYEKEVAPSGTLTLPEGLIRSCNPWFYHIGLDFYLHDQANLIPDMARGFGLGEPTGIEQLPEADGNVPVPRSEPEAIELGIGQAELLVTPLQVVDFIAAVGNGGTLYRPQVVERIADPDGNAIYEFEPEVRGQLPVSEENLAVIQEAMRGVISSPRGTAHSVFLGMQVPIYGKTGTAQSGSGRPHAWFAGYTDAQNSTKPNIAVVVIAENVGEGSEIAAPIFRRILEIYYSGRPTRLYPWESNFYITQTPTSLYTESPTPEETPAP